MSNSSALSKSSDIRRALQWWTQRKVEGYMKTLKQFLETPVVPA
jgi:hypothetical protein